MRLRAFALLLVIALTASSCSTDSSAAAGGEDIERPLLIIVSAFAGAIATHLFSLDRDRRTRHRELIGLLTLLDVEVDVNRNIMEHWQQFPDAMRRPGAPGLVSQVWETNGSRIATHLPTSDLVPLADFYRSVTVLESLRLMEAPAGTTDAKFQRDVINHLPRLEPLGKDALWGRTR